MDDFEIYLKEINQVKLLCPDDETDLVRRMRNGDFEARENLIKANLRLVVHISHDYEGLGLELSDLVSEGNIGLMTAIDRFDPRKGAKISTYAGLWIKQSIRRALANQSRSIRLPVHLIDKIAHMRQAEARLNEILQRTPTDKELACEMTVTVEKISHWRQVSRGTVSLEQMLGDDEDSNRLIDVVPDEHAEVSRDVLVRKTDMSILKSALAQLDFREGTILKLRYGLDGRSPESLSEIGARFGITHERVRQLEEIGLGKLRVLIKTAQSDGLETNQSALENVQSASETESLPLSHYRASPAFINWLPIMMGNSWGKKEQLAVEFVCCAYEVSESSVRGSGNGDAGWARAVAAFLLVKCYGTESIVPDYTLCTQVEKAISSDLLVSRDLGQLEAHFRKVMGI